MEEQNSENLWDMQPSLLVPLFKCGRVYLFTDRQVLTQAAKALDIDWDDLEGSIGVSRQIAGPDGEYAFVLGVFNASVTTLVHELAHVTFNIMARVGVPVNEHDANETFCYMQGELLDYFIPYLSEEL